MLKRLYEHFKGLQKALEEMQHSFLHFFRQVIIYMHSEIPRRVYRKIFIKMLTAFISGKQNLGPFFCLLYTSPYFLNCLQ